MKSWITASLLALCLQAQAFDLQGHRGARGLAPENTLAGFALALSLGVSTLETDIAISRDGVLLISHDPALNPDITRSPDGQFLSSRGPVIWHTDFAELQRYDVGRLKPGTRYAAQYPEQKPHDGARLPKLDELFALVKKSGNTQVRLALETKLTPTAPDETHGAGTLCARAGRCGARCRHGDAHDHPVLRLAHAAGGAEAGARDRHGVPVDPAAQLRQHRRRQTRRVAVDRRLRLRRARLGAEDDQVRWRTHLVELPRRPGRRQGQGGAGPGPDGAGLDGERAGAHGPADGHGRGWHRHRPARPAARRDAAPRPAAAGGDAVAP